MEIIVFSSIIIVSYFFDVFSKKSGIPSVLLLITLGILINVVLFFTGEKTSNIDAFLMPLGMVGLFLIVLEASLDLKLEKKKFWIILKSFLVSALGLGATSYISAKAFSFVLSDLTFENALLYTIPLSILSSAIILPSLGSLSEERKEFMVYESVFSDIIGIIAFYAVLGSSSFSGVITSLSLIILISVIVSYLLIYVFQRLKDRKLFLLIAALMLLFGVGKISGQASLLVVFIFGLILNNYFLFFRGKLKDFVLIEKLGDLLHDFKVVTTESAFVVRTFFFVVFGISISLTSLFDDWRIIPLGILSMVIIYGVRVVILLVFRGSIKIKDVVPELFLAPRGLITIILFFYIPKDVTNSFSFGESFHGVLLFVILSSCIIMTWSLIKEKKKLNEEEKESEIIESENLELEEEGIQEN